MKNAFTLIELITVLAIALTFSLFPVKAYTFHLKAVNTRNIAVTLFNDVIAARQLAAMRGANTVLSIGPAKYTLSVASFSGGLPPVVLERRFLPAKLTGALNIEFSPSGYPVPGKFGTITVSGQRKIVISSAGRIRME